MADNVFSSENSASNDQSGNFGNDQLAQAFPASGAGGVGPGAAAFGTPIGKVDSVVGTVSVTRVSGTREDLGEGGQVYQGDVIETPQGASLGITLLDESSLSLVENSRMVLDEVVFDPSAQTGNISLSAVKGAFVMVSGR